jgi:hypothetical protein
VATTNIILTISSLNQVGTRITSDFVTATPAMDAVMAAAAIQFIVTTTTG